MQEKGGAPGLSITPGDINILKNKNIISEEQKLLIEEYNERLENNNIAVIYNLRHLRKILKNAYLFEAYRLTN